MSEHVDWGYIYDRSADRELRKMETPDRPTCKVCMADLAGGDPHEPWCTLKEEDEEDGAVQLQPGE